MERINVSSMMQVLSVFQQRADILQLHRCRQGRRPSPVDSAPACSPAGQFLLRVVWPVPRRARRPRCQKAVRQRDFVRGGSFVEAARATAEGDLVGPLASVGPSESSSPESRPLLGGIGLGKDLGRLHDAGMRRASANVGKGAAMRPRIKESGWSAATEGVPRPQLGRGNVDAAVAPGIVAGTGLA